MGNNCAEEYSSLLEIAIGNEFSDKKLCCQALSETLRTFRMERIDPEGPASEIGVGK